MDLGQADARPLAHRAVVTGHSELKAAAERCPMDCRRGGERRVLEGGHDLGEGGRHVRLRELRDVGAGRERGPAARDDEARAYGLRGSGIETTPRRWRVRAIEESSEETTKNPGTPRRTAPSAFTGGEVICSTATPFFRAHLTALLVAMLLLQC